MDAHATPRVPTAHGFANRRGIRFLARRRLAVGQEEDRVHIGIFEGQLKGVVDVRRTVGALALDVLLGLLAQLSVVLLDLLFVLLRFLLVLGLVQATTSRRSALGLALAGAGLLARSFGQVLQPLFDAGGEGDHVEPRALRQLVDQLDQVVDHAG